jgi:hypothetical protein
MTKFEIKKGIQSALGGGKPLLDVHFLGIGGAFDTDEGTASALFKTRGGKHFLIDCGYTSYSKLRKWNLIESVDRVFITHTHEDHISGLSTFIYERFFIHKVKTIIECHESVAPRVKQYLDLCGHPEEQYQINIGNVFIEDEGISITKIDTGSNHWPVNNFPNSGLLFHFSVGDDYAVVIYSGDINVPITNLMPQEMYPFVYEKPENVFIFHDMTSLVHEQNPHTNWSLLVPTKQMFNNLFTYHHNQDQVAVINQENPVMAFTSLVIQGDNFVIEENRGI